VSHHKLQDILRKHVLAEALDSVADVTLEKRVAPLDEQRVDACCVLRKGALPESAVPHVGLVRRMLQVSPHCMVEQYSETTSLDEVDDDLRKRYHVQHAIKKTNKDAEKPVLWVTSPGRPETVLAAYVGLPVPGWPDGFYCCASGVRMWVVVLAELPKTPETRLLRMFGPPRMQLEVLKELKALAPDDPQGQAWVDILAEVRYLIEKVPDLSLEEQAVMTELRQRWEREKADLRNSAKAEGKVEGRAEGRAESKAEAVLAVLKARGLAVSEGVRVRVLACRDLSILDRWLVRAATAASDTEVTAA
jgi:hypothetical protein